MGAGTSDDLFADELKLSERVARIGLAGVERPAAMRTKAKLCANEASMFFSF